MGKLRNIIDKKYLTIKLKSIKFFLLCICLFAPIFIYFNSSITKYVQELGNFSISKFLRLNLEKINITGNDNITHKEIVDKIKINRNISIFSINLNDLEKQILELGLVKSVHIERILPSTLNIEIIEKKPIGIIQTKSTYQLITANGSIVNFEKIDKFKNLPIFVGKNVQYNAHEILKILSDVNFKEDIWSIKYINERRWNLNLKKGVKILLPEKNIINALNLIIKIQQKYKILDGNFAEVDIRNPNQIIFEPLINSLVLKDGL